jgi:hypothetical protein
MLSSKVVGSTPRHGLKHRSPVKIDVVLTYCRACMYDNSLAEYISYFKVGFRKYHIMYIDLKKKYVLFI